MINKFSLIPALVTLAMATPALAAVPRINIDNVSGMTIKTVYMTVRGVEDDGPDVLGRNALRHGYRISLPLPSYSTGACRYDLKFTFVGGRSLPAYDVNACAADTVRVTADSIHIA